MYFCVSIWELVSVKHILWDQPLSSSCLWKWSCCQNFTATSHSFYKFKNGVKYDEKNSNQNLWVNSCCISKIFWSIFVTLPHKLRTICYFQVMLFSLIKILNDGLQNFTDDMPWYYLANPDMFKTLEVPLQRMKNESSQKQYLTRYIKPQYCVFICPMLPFDCHNWCLIYKDIFWAG